MTVSILPRLKDVIQAVTASRVYDLFVQTVRIVYLFALWFGFFLGLFLLFFPWKPNIALGYLAGGAFLVALRGDERVTQRQRALWAVITIVLCAAEYRAIKKESEELFKAHLQELIVQREAQAQTMEFILETSNSQMMQNQVQFNQTLANMRTLAHTGQKAIHLSSETIRQITGGNTWVDIGPVRLGRPLEKLTVNLHGEHPFYGASLEVYDVNGLHFRRPTFPFPAPPNLVAATPLGTYYADKMSHLLSLSVPITNERYQEYEFRVSSRTGMIQEFMKLCLKQGNWLTAGEIRRGKELLSEWKDPGFPEDWKLEPPTQPLDPHLSPTQEYSW